MTRALTVTYEDHRQRLQAVASRYTTEDAEDIVQDAFVHALQNGAQFRYDAELSTWLYRIVVNECISRYRRLRRRERARQRRPYPEPASAAQFSSDVLDVRAALRALPRREYRVLVMHDVIGHTHDEIAAFLKIPTGTSKWRLGVARRWLRALSLGTCADRNTAAI